MPSTRTAFLFDLDGTLLDTAPEFTYCMNQILAEDSLPLITLDGLRPFISSGTSGMIQHTFQNFPAMHDHHRLKERFLNYYRENIGSQTYFFDEIGDLLQTFQKAAVPWGIVTNKPTEFTLPLIKQFSPLQEAHCVIAGDTLSVSKPEPAPLFLAAKQLKIDPQQCWYVGDAEMDVLAARAAGMGCVIVNYGYLPLEEDPQQWGADFYFDNPLQLLTLLSQTP